MKTKIVLLIGLLIVLLYGYAFAEIFLQVHTSGGVFSPQKAQAGVLTEISDKPFQAKSLFKTAGMLSSSYFSELRNEDRLRKTTGWFFDLIDSDGMKTPISDGGKSTRTPIPPAIYLLGTGLVGLAGFRGRQRKK